MDKYFIEVNSITYQYPYGIDKIIAKMILKHPYIDNSMNLKLSIMRKTAKVDSFYHILNFRNYNYENQVKGDTTIKYELD